MINKIRIPMIFLWTSSMGYIFVSSYYENEKKQKLMNEKKLIQKPISESYDKFKDPNYNPFKSYRP